MNHAFRGWGGLLSTTVLGVLLCGCPHRIEFGPEGEITDAKQMVALLAKQDARFVTLQGEVKLKVQSPQGSGTVSQFLAVTRPAALHIETFNFFGKPVSVLVSDGDRFSLYDADKNVFYGGPATTESMARFLPIALAPEEAVALILGQVPRIPAQSATLVLDAERGRYRLTLKAGEIQQVLEIDPKTLDILRSTVTGAEAYNLQLEDYRNEPGGRFPHQITLDAPASNVELTYKYGDVKVNGAPDLTLFHQDPPPSAQRVELDAAGKVAPAPATDGGI
jgi:hypothetical protein